MITCLCISARRSLRRIPVELLGWRFHLKRIKYEAQVCGEMSGDEQNKSDGVLSQVMLNDIACGCTARRNLELAVTRSQMPFDGAIASMTRVGSLTGASAKKQIGKVCAHGQCYLQCQTGFANPARPGERDEASLCIPQQGTDGFLLSLTAN